MVSIKHLLLASLLLGSVSFSVQAMSHKRSQTESTSAQENREDLERRLAHFSEKTTELAALLLCDKEFKQLRHNLSEQRARGLVSSSEQLEYGIMIRYYERESKELMQEISSLREYLEHLEHQVNLSPEESYYLNDCRLFFRDIEFRVHKLSGTITSLLEKEIRTIEAQQIPINGTVPASSTSGTAGAASTKTA